MNMLKRMNRTVVNFCLNQHTTSCVTAMWYSWKKLITVWYQRPTIPCFEMKTCMQDVRSSAIQSTKPIGLGFTWASLLIRAPWQWANKGVSKMDAECREGEGRHTLWCHGDITCCTRNLHIRLISLTLNIYMLLEMDERCSYKEGYLSVMSKDVIPVLKGTWISAGA